MLDLGVKILSNRLNSKYMGCSFYIHVVVNVINSGSGLTFFVIPLQHIVKSYNFVSSLASEFLVHFVFLR